MKVSAGVARYSVRHSSLLAALFTALLVVLLAVPSAHAAVFDHELSASNRPALTAALAQMTSSELVYGDFRQVKTIKKLNREFVSTGAFMISKSYGITWQTQKPFASTLIVNHDGISQQAADGKLTKVSASDNPVFAEISKTIQAVFSGNVKELENNFKVYFEKNSVGLVPRESTVRKVIASIVLEGSTTLDRMSVTDADGNPVVYEFSNQKSMSEKDLQANLSKESKLIKMYGSLKGEP